MMGLGDDVNAPSAASLSCGKDASNEDVRGGGEACGGGCGGGSGGTGWAVKASVRAQRTRNPIRRLVDKLQSGGSQCGKPVIPLSLGDPTVYGNLLPPEPLTNVSYRHHSP